MASLKVLACLAEACLQDHTNFCKIVLKFNHSIATRDYIILKKIVWNVYVQLKDVKAEGRNGKIFVEVEAL